MKIKMLTLAFLLMASGLSMMPADPGDSTLPVVGFSQLDSLMANPGEVTWVMNFWATWCRPCVQELPDFELLEKTYLEDPSVRVLLVSLDFTEKIQTDVVPFIDRHKVISEVWVLDEPDANSWIDRIDPSWSGAIPATLIFNSRQRHFHEGIMSYQELEEYVQQLQNP